MNQDELEELLEEIVRRIRLTCVPDDAANISLTCAVQAHAHSTPSCPG